MTWQQHAACRDRDPEIWFPERDNPSTDYAIAICGTCPVRDECLAAATTIGETAGIWGGKDLGAAHKHSTRGDSTRERIQRMIAAAPIYAGGGGMTRHDARHARVCCPHRRIFIHMPSPARMTRLSFVIPTPSTGGTGHLGNNPRAIHRLSPPVSPSRFGEPRKRCSTRCIRREHTPCQATTYRAASTSP